MGTRKQNIRRKGKYTSLSGERVQGRTTQRGVERTRGGEVFQKGPSSGILIREGKSLKVL